MQPRELENWRKIKDNLEKAGKTDCWYYRRALCILSGFKDPLEHPPLDLSGEHFADPLL